MKEKSELAKEFNKDVISILISIIDNKTDEYYLHTTDSYYIDNNCEFKAIAVGNEISVLGNKFIVNQLNLSFEMVGLSDTKTPEENTKGVFNPHCAILSVYVTKKL